MTTPAPAPVAAAAAGRRKRFFAVFFTVLVLAACGYGAWWHRVLRHQESTDDAYVAGNVVRVMSQVPGKVLAVLADDTDYVHAGQVLVRLDPADARLALDRALVELAVVTREVCRLLAQLHEGQAQIELAEISLRQAEINLQRREVLGRQNAVRVEELHDYRTQVKSSEAQLEANRRRRQALAAQLAQAPLAEQPRVRQAAAHVRESWLALQRTSILSPVSGQVVQRSVQPGAVVSAGTSLLSVVPLDALWVDANFKEVQLRRMRIGQAVTVRVDLHGASVTYAGKVAGFAAGTGSAFALIPPQNATGNWIKVVQRVPVRIEIAAESLRQHPLLIGLSSVVTVDVSDDSGRLLYDGARERPLSPVLAAQGIDVDMAPVEELIATTIAANDVRAE